MKEQDSIKVLVVDDHQMVRDSLRLVLDEMENIKVVGEASDGEAAIRKNEELSPDIILMDLRMPNMDGLQAMIKIKSQHPETKIMVLSVMDEKQSVREAFNTGASGYAVKEIREAELESAINQINSGKYYVHPSIVSHLFSELSNVDILDLNKKELDILAMIAEGISNDELAKELGQTSEGINETIDSILDKIKPLEKVQDVAIVVRKEQD